MPSYRAVTLLVALVLAAPAATGAQVSPAARPPTAADVGFVQGMIQHHSQALEMTALISERTQRADLRNLGERITVSQRDEIAMMSQWLKVRGEQTTPRMQHDGHVMPGMLTAAQMDSLRASRGTAFDRLFLKLMIQHHEGALTMVKDLLATPRAAQEPQLFSFVSDVDTDQRAEIARMQALLDTIRH